MCPHGEGTGGEGFVAILGRLMGCGGGLCREGARRLRLGRWEAVGGGERWLSQRPRAVDVRGRAD